MNFAVLKLSNLTETRRIVCALLLQALLAAARIKEVGGKNEYHPLTTTACREDDQMDTANDGVDMQTRERSIELARV